MNELQKMLRAKMYMDKLVNGINPLTGFRLNAGDIVKDDRVIACFEYISEVLQRNIEDFDSNYTTSRRTQQKPFMTDDQYAQIRVSYEPVLLIDIANEINRVIKDNDTKKILGVWINDWLESREMLMKNAFGNRIATDLGNRVGIKSELRNDSMNGDYYVNLFSDSAQRYVYDNFENIIEYHYNGR